MDATLEELTCTFSQNQDAYGCGVGNDMTVQAIVVDGAPILILNTSRWCISPDEIDGFAALLRSVVEKAKG